MNDDHTINVQIGNDSPVVYHIRQTRAPLAYDGFGTIQLQDVGGGKVVRLTDN